MHQQIELVRVESARIAAIGYSETEGVLAIRFPPTRKAPGGKVYHYEGVTPETWQEFRNSESLGGYFARHILNNPHHPCRCVDKGEPDVAPASQPVTALASEAESLKSRAVEASEQAKALAIHSPEAYAQAGARLKQLIVEKKQAQQRVSQIKGPAFQTYKAALQLEKDVMAPYAQAEQWIKSGMARYLTEEESARHRREVALTLQAVESAKEAGVQQAELEAQLLEAQGEEELAAQVRTTPVAAGHVLPVVLQKEVPRVEGVSSRKNWSFRIVDERLLPREYLMPNESAIRQVVRALKEKTNIPGVELYCEETVAVRA